MSLSSDVVALFVDPRGPYPSLVERWYDEKRDATTYRGPLPVVAHPPCGPWSSLRHLWRGEGRELAVFAVGVVRRFGGVLEHPRGSKLWEHLGLPRPGAPADSWGGRTFEVSQCDWGHVARKRTWLYAVGIEDLGELPAPREPTHWVSGRRGMADPRDNVPPGIKVCSAAQRNRTPRAFAEFLVGLAKRSSPIGFGDEGRFDH